MKQTRYSPGTPGTITSAGNGTYHVQSHRNPEVYYHVDLTADRCSCPDSQKRDRACKHCHQARAESFRRTLRTAAGMDLLTLRRELERPGRRPEVREAISQTIEKRAERMIEGGAR